MSKIQVIYYAALREARGCTEEELETESATARDLYQELSAQHGFELDIARVRVAINDEFVEWSTGVSEGDHIVFIPPVSGG